DRETAVPDNSLMLDVDDVAIHGPPGARGCHFATLYVDTGRGYRPELTCSGPLPDRSDDFEVTYRLAEFGPVQAVRRDPAAYRLRLTAVRWTDESGRDHDLDPACVRTNGTRQDDGWVRFETPDPAVVLPLSGTIARLTLRGACEVDGVEASLERLAGVYQET